MAMQNIPMSGRAMERFIPRVMKYGALRNMRELPERPTVVLYETKPNFGHWTGIFDTPEGIEFFDSYGYAPDQQLNWVPKRFRIFSGQEEKRILRMLYDSNVPINFNAHRLQRGRSMTCGRWVILRYLYSHLTSDEFAARVFYAAKKLGITPDELVSRVVTVSE